MRRALITCGILIGCFLVFSCSSDRESTRQTPGVSTESLSEETISDFVGVCIKFRKTSECVCHIDELARSTSESAIRKMLTATNFAELLNLRQSQCFDRSRSNAASPLSSASGEPQLQVDVAGPSPSSGTVLSGPASARAKTTTEPIERAASTAEICLQDKINGEMQRKGGDVSIAKFDQFRAECGL